MEKYPRPAYGQEGAKITTNKMIYLPHLLLTIPEMDFPIKPIDNFRLAAARKTPHWMPNALTDFQSFFPSDWLEGFKVFPYGDEVESVYFDEFGCQWKYLPSAYGSMLNPTGKPVCDDVTKWEKQVKFPELKLLGTDFMEKSYDPNKVLHVDVFQGVTERFVALMGGYTEAMLALVEEPDACGDFFNAFAEWEIRQFDKMFEKYPINFITYHDDWGTERDTFFSERVMEELVYQPTKRIVEHIRDKGVIFELHTCGKIGRFMKYMVELNIDFLWIQPRANDIAMMKREVGDKIGFQDFGDLLQSPEPTKDDIAGLVRETVDKIGKSGGSYVTAIVINPESVWNFCHEMFAYSREYYDRERGE